MGMGKGERSENGNRMGMGKGRHVDWSEQRSIRGFIIILLDKCHNEKQQPVGQVSTGHSSGSQGLACI